MAVRNMDHGGDRQGKCVSNTRKEKRGKGARLMKQPKKEKRQKDRKKLNPQHHKRKGGVGDNGTTGEKGGQCRDQE